MQTRFGCCRITPIEAAAAGCAIARPHLADPAWTLHEAARIGMKSIAWPKQYVSGKQQYEANLERAAAVAAGVK